MGSIVNSVLDVVGVGPASQQQKGINSAAAASQASADRALTLQGQMFDKQQGYQQPYYDVGVNALNKFNSQAPFDPNAFNYQADPGYAFRLKEGMNQMNATAAARGGLISGNALRAGQNYGQEMGSQEYKNAYDRYVQGYGINNSNSRFLINSGQNAANNLASIAGNYGQNAANTILGQGANRANSELQLGNSRASQYGNYGNAIGQIGSMAMGAPGGSSYTGPSYGTNASFDNSWFDTNSYD